MKNYVIILAGGSGCRFDKDIPKQFQMLGELPVLMHTILAYYHSDICPEIILVLNRNFHKYWKDLCAHHNFQVPLTIINGGKERFDSVKNGLAILHSECIVGVHDGVRPFITNRVIINAYLKAAEMGNAVPAVTAVNTIRYSENGESSRALDRSKIYIVQNPQVFVLSQIKDAYKQPYNSLFTDDATVAEARGIKINLIQGDRRNIKITHRVDMSIANGILEYNKHIDYTTESK